MPLPKGVYRADHVGSLLRPKAIKDAREKAASNTITQSQLREIEDAEIAKTVKKQLDVGIRSITDGEFRRAYFHLDFLKRVGGVSVQGQMKSTSKHSDNFSPPKLVVTGKLRHEAAIQVADFEFLESRIAAEKGITASTKVCIPSPTMVHFRGGRASISIESYPDLSPFFEDLAEIYQTELALLYAAGCRMVQLDDTNLAYLCDPKMREDVSARNEDPSILPQKYADLINASISKVPSDMTIAIHLCRGNYRSQWFASGGYEPVAQTLFQSLNVSAYFLEYDDARSGDFAPLRWLPEGKVVVLGLMSSKKRDLDDKETIVKRLKEAAEFCPLGLEQLCLSHQCGFSSTQEGNELSEDEQWKKLALEVEIARSVWDDA